MVLNQLFIDIPPITLLNRMITAFGLNNINDTKEFSQLDINKHKNLINGHTPYTNVQTDGI